MRTRTNANGTLLAEIVVEPYTTTTVVFTRRDGPVMFSVGTSSTGHDFRLAYVATAPSIILAVATEEEPDTLRDPKRGT